MKRMLLVALALGACEKADAGASGPLGSSDTTLLADVPSGNVALFGGNYMKFEDFMQSSLGQMTGRMFKNASGADNLTKWVSCFVSIGNVQMVGGVVLDSHGVTMRTAFRGMSLGDITHCADQAGMTSTTDPDGKFVAVQVAMLGTQFTYGYLQLPDGALYARQGMQLGVGMSGVASTTRADLEADVASLAQGNAAGDTHLLDLAAKVDRRHAFWFAGAFGGTPYADKVGDVYGSFDFDDGMKADARIQFHDDALARKITDGLDMAHKMADRLPADLRAALDGIHVERDDAQVHVRVALSSDQMKALTQIGAMGMH